MAAIALVVASAGALGAVLASIWMPSAQEELRWLRFIAFGVVFVSVVRWIPHAWHYRRDDRTGLAFVLIFTALMGYGVCAALFRW